MPETYPRDLVGYGRTPPDPRWPGNARVAVQFVLNYEEGGENSILHGDPASEAFLSEIIGAQAWPGMRHMNMELIYEYGSRAGFWRIWRLFTRRKLPLTVYGVATALMRNPPVVAAMQEADWEIASHGLKWIEYKDTPEAIEREHMMEAIKLHTAATGARPLGWYLGRCTINTRKLVMEEGGFLYDSDFIRRRSALLGRRARAVHTSSSPTRSTPTTCGLRWRRASIPVTNSSHICATPSMCFMPRAPRRRRCCRLDCTAGWSGAPDALPRSNASSIMSRA